jgi:choline dehydrogenase
VGENLHDHPVCPVLWPTKGTTDIAFDHVTPARLVQWQALGRGPLVSNIGEGGGFVATRGGLEGPDMQFHAAPTGFYDNGLREPKRRLFTLGATLVDVHSRGRLRLRSADPRWKPVLDPAYFAEAADLAAMVAGVRQSLEIARHAPLAKYVDGPPPIDGDSDRAVREYVREWTQTLYHPVGTCAMGDGEQSVVDAELRVHGMENLRVADASVMPRITRGNTNAPTVMIGEKAADLIKGRTASSAPSRAKESVR